MPTNPAQHLSAIVQFAHDVLARSVPPGAHVIDATAGNGHDTAVLAQLVGSTGRVWAFDVQAAALQSTHQRLQQLGLDDGRVVFIHASHADLAQHVATPVQAVIFNLGWLPGSDKALITRSDSTLAALDAALAQLAVHGVLVIVLYQGHDGARTECIAVEDWLARQSPAAVRAVRYQLAHHCRRPPPYVLALEKIAASV